MNALTFVLAAVGIAALLWVRHEVGVFGVEVGSGLMWAIGAEVFLALAALGACLYFGIRLAQHVTVPVEELTEAASMISHGDLSVQVERTRDDEIGDLQDSLARMATAIRFFQAEHAYEATPAEMAGVGE